MARKRMIDPSIWTDEGMAEMTPRQQLLYIGLFSNADDDGRLKGSPLAISLMLPTLYSSNDRGAIAEDLESVLSTMNQLVRYEVDGREYLAFRNYRQWQRIDKPTDSHLPPPPDEIPATTPKSTPRKDHSSNAPRKVAEESESPTRDVVPNRKEQKGREQKDDADESASTQDAPFALLEALCETQGQDVSVLSKTDKNKQLAVAKRLIESGMSARDVRTMTAWLMGQSWVTGGIDLFLIEKQAAKWKMAGRPEPKPANVTALKNLQSQEIDNPFLLGPERVAYERQKWIEANPEEAKARGWA